MSESPIQSIDPDQNPKMLRWSRDKSNASLLESFLSSPTGELLIDVLREFAIPQQTPGNLGLAHTPEVKEKLAYMQCIHSGQHLTIEHLLALRHATPEPDQADLGEWSGKSRVDEQVKRQKDI